MKQYKLVLIGGQYKFLYERMKLIADDLKINITQVKPCHIYFDIESKLDFLNYVSEQTKDTMKYYQI